MAKKFIEFTSIAFTHLIIDKSEINTGAKELSELEGSFDAFLEDFKEYYKENNIQLKTVLYTRLKFHTENCRIYGGLQSKVQIFIKSKC